MGFPVGPGTGRHHHLQPAVGDCGSIGQARVVAARATRGIEPPGFRGSQRLVVCNGNYRGGSVPLPVVRPLAAHYSLLTSMLSQVADGCAGTCIVLGFQRTVGWWSCLTLLNSTMPTLHGAALYCHEWRQRLYGCLA